MARDLFAESVNHAPTRTSWTIAGSILAHVALVLVLVIAPILAGAGNIVALAQDLVFLSPTLPSIPPPPPASAPPRSAPAMPDDINPNAAPSEPPTKPVTGDAVPTGPVIPGGLPFGTPGAGLGDSITTPVTLAPPPPPVVEKPQGPVRPGGNIKTPERIAFVEPVYPTIAKAVKLGGYVILEATIDERGMVQDLRVLKSDPMFDAAAVAAVSKWRYTPTMLNGKPVPVLLTVTVRFSL